MREHQAGPPVPLRNPAPPPREQCTVAKRVPEEFVLLCESCGYDIESLPPHAPCPECGRAVASSLPGQRAGTPWQNRGTLRSLVQTWFRTLTNPRATFDSARPATRASEQIGSTVLVAAILPMLAVALVMSGRQLIDLIWHRPALRLLDFELAPPLIATSATGAAVLLGLTILTLIEERGIRFWGPRRGWRITPAIASVVCAHATVGWVLASILAVAGHALGLVLVEITHRHNLGVFRGPMQLSPISLPALGFITGLLTFETLVYIGMGRMKHANRARSDAPVDASVPPAATPPPDFLPGGEPPHVPTQTPRAATATR